MKKWLLTPLLILSFSFSLTAPAQDELPYGLKSGKPYDGTKLNIMAVVTPQFDGYRLRSNEFTEMTGIELEWTMIPFVALQEKVASVGVAADGNFDVVNYLDSWGPANAHWFLRLDEWMTRDGVDPNRYPQAFIKSAQFQGETIGLPLRAHPQLFFYRKDIFDELGLEAPKTWDDVVEIGKKIKQSKPDIGPLALYFKNDGNRQSLFIWLNFLWGNGADVFDDNTCPAWHSEQGLQATRDYVALHTVHQITSKGSETFVEQDARQSFQQGNSAMMPVWWWAYSPMTNPDQSVLTKEQVAFTGMPVYKGDAAVTYAISMPYSISQYSQNPEAAWEFMKWLSNPDLDRLNALHQPFTGNDGEEHTIINNVVTHKTSLEDPDVNAANNNIQYAAAESLQRSDIMPQIPEWPEVADLLANAIESAVTGGDVDQLMQDAAAQAERVLKRAGYCR
jgi:ABC-type glycerol-3-phosphate transport system substrate-binding protein